MVFQWFCVCLCYARSWEHVKEKLGLSSQETPLGGPEARDSHYNCRTFVCDSIIYEGGPTGISLFAHPTL